KPRDQWSVLIQDHHEGYVTWDIYQRIEKMLAGNSSRSSAPGPGAAKNGAALLAGLLSCRRRGRKLFGADFGPNCDVPRYQCTRGAMDTAEPKCISFGGTMVDKHVVAEALRVVQPVAIEAATLAAEKKRATQDELLTAIALDLKAANYEAERARKRYE